MKHKAGYVTWCSKPPMAPISHRAKASPYNDNMSHHTVDTPQPHYSADPIFYFLHHPPAILPSLQCFKNIRHVPFSVSVFALFFVWSIISPDICMANSPPFMSLSKIQLLSNHLPLPQQVKCPVYALFFSPYSLPLFNVIDIFCSHESRVLICFDP